MEVDSSFSKSEVGYLAITSDNSTQVKKTILIVHQLISTI